MKPRAFSGLRLQRARLAAGMTQADLAFEMRRRGVKTTPTGVARWENRHHMPRANVVPVIADVLGCSMEELYGDGDEEEDPASVLLRAAQALARHGDHDLAAEVKREAARASEARA